jgi:4-methylaminobutanoate oxidase (formaldehyde-forming)
VIFRNHIKISFLQNVCAGLAKRAEDVLSAYYMPDDGVVNPVDTAMSMAIGARKGGALIFEDTVVLDFEMKNDQVVGIKTDKGDIKCESTVLCAGMWSRELGRKLGISVPIHACQHMYFVTLPIEGTYKGMPILRDQDGCLYFREEVGGLLIGAFEYGALPYGTNGIPGDWSFRELPDDMDHLEPLMENAIKRVPELANAEIRRITTTAEGFTPDNMYIMGEAPGMKKLYTACGMNSSGILCGAGVGKKTAEWIVEGYPESGHIWEADNRRCFSWMMNTKWLKDRAPETPGNLYGIHFPFKQFETAEMSACLLSMTAWLNEAPVSDNCSDMNAPTGLPLKASSLNMNTVSFVRTGSITRLPNIRPCVKVWGFTTFLPWLILSCKARMRFQSYKIFAATT